MSIRQTLWRYTPTNLNAVQQCKVNTWEVDMVLQCFPLANM